MFAELTWNKPRAWRINMAVTLAVLVVRVKPLRQNDVQLVLGPRHGHVKQATLFFDLRDGPSGEVGWKTAIDCVEQEDGCPFLAFGGMDRRQDQIVLVEQRCPSLVTGRLRRVECELGEKTLAARVGGCYLGKLLQVVLTDS